MKTTAEKFCVICVTLGALLPWAMLFIAAGLGLFGTGEATGKASAYLACAGLVVMLLSYLFGRASNRISSNLN